jgi:DNA polymerase-3 subunit epsilon
VSKFAVIDLETTGVRARSDRIIEAAIFVLSSSGELTERVNTLVNPERATTGTDVHGIEAADVAHAPRFAEIAGDIFSALHDAVIVGHNVRFDIAFIAAEASACGWILPPAPFLCTLELGAKLGFADQGRRLMDFCTALGIEHGGPHQAASDARAIAAIFMRCLERMPQPARELILSRSGAAAELWPAVPESGRGLKRTEARGLKAMSPCYIAALLSKLPPTGANANARPNMLAYLAFIDRVLEDRYISPHEGEALHAMALEWGLGAAEVRAAHESYLDSLIIAALKDGVVCDVERADLLNVARLLGMEERAFDRHLADARRGIEAFVRCRS